VTDNPANKTRNPQITGRPTMPFSQDEMIRIYAAWEQEQLEADVRGTWKTEFMLSGQTNGAPEVHGRRELVNSMKTKEKPWRRGWESNPRIKVLQPHPRIAITSWVPMSSS